MRPAQVSLHLALLTGHILVLFNAAIYVAAIPKAAGDLGVAPSFGTWAQTYFMMGWALSVPVANWLGSRFGRVRVFIWGLSAFLLASVLCAWAPEFPLFLLGRILLGFPGGLVLLLSNAIALQSWPAARRVEFAHLWTMAALTPLALGGAIGGWIIDNLGWRWLFYLNLAIGLPVLATVAAILPVEKDRHAAWRFDWIGYGLLVIIMAGTHTLLNLGNDWDWWNAKLLVAVGIATAVAFLYWIAWELTTPYPAVDLRLLYKSRNFLIAVLCLAVGFFFIQGLYSFLIVRLQLIFGYETWLAGLAFLPLLLAKPMVVVCHHLMRQFDLRVLISLDLLGLAFAFSWFGRLDRSGWLDQLHWPMLLEGLCLGVFFPTLTALLLAGGPLRYHRRILEQANILRLAAGSWGISSMGVIAYLRTPFHRTHLVESDTLGDPGLQELLTRLGEAGFAPDAARLQLEQLVAKQAAILGFDDPFLLAAKVFVVLAAITWLADPVHLPVRLRFRFLWKEQQLEEP